MKRDYILESILKENEDKLKEKKRSRRKLILFITLGILILTGIIVYAAIGDYRPTYCLTCQADNTHARKNILDYADKYKKDNLQSGFAIKNQDNKILKYTTGPTELAYAIVGDTLKFESRAGSIVDMYDFQYDTPSGRSLEYNRISKSTFENKSVKLTEPGCYKFYLAVSAGDVCNYNGEHIVLGHNSKFPNGVYTFFVEIDIEVKEFTPTLNIEYYTADKNTPIKTEQKTYNYLNLENKNGAYYAKFNANDNIPSGYTYDNYWILYNDADNKSIDEGRDARVAVNPAFTPAYPSKTVKIKVKQFSIPSKSIDVNIQYRLDNENGKELAPSEVRTAYINNQFNFSANKIDGCTIKNIVVKGQEEKIINAPSFSCKINNEKWNTPVNEKIDIFAIYSLEPVIVVPECKPRIYGNDKSASLNMKKSTFNNLNQITVNNIDFNFDDMIFGQDKNKLPVEGNHNFHWFDFYIKDSSKNIIDAVYHIKSQSYTHTFNVSKNQFTKVSSAGQPEVWKAGLLIDYAVRCDCAGYGFDLNKHLDVYINIIENKPPTALFKPITKVKLEDGSDRIIEDVYINQISTLKNMDSDPNGIDDILIENTEFVFTNMERFYVKVRHENGSYMLEDHNISSNKYLELNTVDKYTGDIDIKFKTDTVCTVNRYVEDIEGLSDIYTQTIAPKKLSLNPIAKLTDIFTYRFPYGLEFSAKQTRTGGLSSSTSDVASFLKGTGVVIDHNKDCMEIIPLDGQSIDNIYFENDIVSLKENGVLKIKNVNMTTCKLMFKECGRYRVKLQVTDTQGHISKWAEQIICIVQDTKPQTSIALDKVYYRNSQDKVAKIMFYIKAESNDYDTASITDVKYKYDSNDNGSFEDESLSVAKLATADTVINGVPHKAVLLESGSLGRYQFRVTVKDTFGQETIDKYINQNDYQTNIVTGITEIGNYAPWGSLTLSENRKKKVDIKILVGDLSGTRRTDLDRIATSFEQAIQSGGELIPTVEIINTAKSSNGQGLTWRKVVMNGNIYGGYWSTNIKERFWFKDIPDMHTKPTDNIIGTRVEELSPGIFANGWNGIPVSDMHIDRDLPSGYSLTHSIIDIGLGGCINDCYVGSKTHAMQSSGHYVKIGTFLRSSVQYLHGTYGAAEFQAVSNEKLSDFDIKFNLVTEISGGWGGTTAAENMKYFLFNVKDANNYYALYVYKPQLQYTSDNTTYLHTTLGLDSPGSKSLVEGIIRVKNGKMSIVRQFDSVYDLGKPGHYNVNDRWIRPIYNSHTISRIKQVGNTLELYKSEVANPLWGDSLVTTVVLDDNNIGGRVGVGVKGDMVDIVALDILSLTYLENGNMADTLNNTTWQDDSDKYVINIQENANLDEIKNVDSMNKSVGVLQANNISLINVGVNNVNGNAFKQMISKNGNNGTYIELGSISDNLNTAAIYIKNKSKVVDIDNPLYILVDTPLRYTSTYGDTENDLEHIPRYKYMHTPTYFDNSDGYIYNNGAWTEEKIDTFSKVGKYIIQYQTQDRPRNYDSWHGYLGDSFASYRKYSQSYTKEIYVHRKPVAKFSVDIASLKANGQAPLVDNSFDYDHTSLSNQGIVEWEWKVALKDGTINKKSFTVKSQGESWINSQIRNQAWVNSTVILRVKDLEGVWSDNLSYTLGKDSDPDVDLVKKPIANFTIQSNPMILGKETQVIKNSSYDLQGLALTSYWQISKANLKVNSTGDINALLNQKIRELGTGTYTITLKVVNSKGLESSTVSKTFTVIILNTAPVANFDLVSNEYPAWTFPKVIGVNTFINRTANTFFYEEKTRFNLNISDPDADNLGFIYNWKVERFAMENLLGIGVNPDNVYNYTTQYPFADSFKNVKLPWGAYKITLSVTDKPPIPPYKVGDEKSASITKNYYIVPEINITGNYESINSEIMAGDDIRIKAKTSKEVTSVNASFENNLISLGKTYEDSNYIYWEKGYIIPQNITNNGTYYINFEAYTNYGGNGTNTRKVSDRISIEIITNKPPIITDSQIYAQLGGSYIYENDDVNFRMKLHDVDLSPVTVDVKLYDSNNRLLDSASKLIKPIGNEYPQFDTKDFCKEGFLHKNIPLGNYKVIATVTDDCNESVTIIKDFTAHDLWVKGSVTHTTDWEANRQNYNAKYPLKARDENTYWNGEALETSADTTVINENSNVICNKISVEIINKDKPADKHYLKWLNANNTVKNKWSLSYWDKEWLVENGYVIVRWGSDKKQELTLRFKAYFNNDWVENHDVKIFIDNQDDYWKLHRAW